jgi:GMP synthase-like glutamine amidotransferase
MTESPNLQRSLELGLDDLLAELQDARRYDELGRLALLAYCDVRSWARQAGETDVAHHSTAIFTEQPHSSKEAFLRKVDDLIEQLQQARPRLAQVESIH